MFFAIWLQSIYLQYKITTKKVIYQTKNHFFAYDPFFFAYDPIFASYNPIIYSYNPAKNKANIKKNEKTAENIFVFNSFLYAKINLKFIFEITPKMQKND